MSDFDIIEFGYNTADETINFGTRCLADDDNLHEVTTLAALRSDSDEGNTSPYMNAVAQEGRIYFTVNKTARIFKDRQCSDVIFNAVFQSIIDTMCVSPQGDFLLICSRDGNVHLIDCHNEFNCVMSGLIQRDDEGDRFFIASFVHDGRFLIVTKTGQVYKTLFHSVLNMECVHEFNFRAEIASFQFPFLLVSGTTLAILDLENNNVVSDECWKFKRIFPLAHMFVALDCEGHLFKICALTLLVIPLDNPSLFKDMEVLSECNQKQIIAVTEHESQSYILLFSYPDFEQLFSIQVSNQIHLISLDSLNDEILYISKIISNESVSELRFQVVNETEPQQRLQRLLKKRKYEEAEKFAKLFNLDMVLIQKARAVEITEKTNCASEDIENLIHLLDSIDDDEFRLQCCLDVESSCNKFDDINRILTYGCKLQLKRQETRLAAETLQKSIANSMWRFQTYITINRDWEQASRPWLEFAYCDLMEEVKLLLKNHRIEEAKIIYSRLDDLTSEKLAESHVSDILNVLNNISISTFEPFLPIFISITLSILPSSFPLFVEWTHSKVFYLEKSGKSDFPNNAIRFTENIVGLMRVADAADIAFQRQCILHQESLTELSRLLSTLKTLKTLKDEYRISIPVKNYLSGPQNVVRRLLNIEMCAEDYDVFLKRFLYKYMVENHMEPNEIFLGEIMDLVKYEERYWVAIIESILNCISSVAVKLEAVKCVLGEARAPWSDPVRKIANEAVKYSHPLAAEIKELIDAEPMQVVLIKPRYQIRERKVGSADLAFTLKRIIYCDEPSMVEDVYQLCKTPRNRHVGTMLLVNNFIRKGYSEKALNLLDDNTPEELLECTRELAITMETFLNNEVGLPDELLNNYYNVAGSIFRRLDDVSDEFDRVFNRETLTLIQNVHSLNKHFNIKTTTYDLRNRAIAAQFVDDILEKTLYEFRHGKQTVDDVFDVCYKLSHFLGRDYDDVLRKFCEKSTEYNVIMKAAQRVCDSDAGTKDMCLMAVLLLKYVGTYKLQLLDESSDSESSLMVDSDLVDDEVFCNGLKLAGSLVAKAMCKAKFDEEALCMEVARWVRMSFYFTKSGDSDLKRKLFGDVYDAASVLPGFLTFSTIKNVFVGFCKYSSGLNNPNTLYLTTEPITEEDYVRDLKLLPPVLENMSKEGQHFTAYSIVQTLQDCLMQVPNPNPKILKFLNEVLKKKCIPKVLASILSNSVVDADLLYSLLLLCDRDDAAKFIINSWKMYKRHPKKFACVTKIGLKFWEYYKIAQGKSEMVKALTVMKWWKKFDAKKLDYDVFFKMKSGDRFEFLVNSDCLDVVLAKEYCKDFKLDTTPSYKAFLMNLLLNWKPDYKIGDEDGRKRLTVKNDEDELLKKCLDVMNLLDREQVLHIVMNVWDSVNTYYYEVFLTMLDILSMINSEQDNHAKRSMLIFLKNYQRVSKPSETEIEHWFTSYPDTQSIDVLSEFRLSFSPFLFTEQIFDIIRPEINLATYKLWFNAIDILKPYLTKNKICSFVVKDVVASGVLSKDASNEWVLFSKHDDLFKEIDDCVMNISDLELATSVVYHLMTHTLNGADQVTAAKLCYKYAVEYRRLNPESSNVEKAVIKVEKKYYACCGMHILYTHQLAEPKYLNLLSQPKELILALFFDERILKKNASDLLCPNINKAAEALASLFKLDIKKIRHELIQSSLGSEDILNTQLNFDSSIVYTSGACSDDENLDRLAYVCCSDDLKFWQTRLFYLGIGSETGEQMSVHCKARALKVFAMISDVETIIKLTEGTYDEFMNFIDKLTVVSNLEYLGIGMDIEALVQCNKKELLNRLVQRSGSVLGIKTMALICMTFSIYDVKFWEFIVNSAIAFSLFVELKTYVKFLKKVKCQYKTFYINAWQKLVDNSFARLTNSSDMDDALVSNFLTIQSCPVLFSLNLENALRRCMDRKKPEFAAVLLQYFDSNRRDEYVKQIRNSNKDLVASLNNLEQKGLWGIAHVKTILA